MRSRFSALIALASVTYLFSLLINAGIKTPLAIAAPENCPDYVYETVEAVEQSKLAIEVAQGDLDLASERVEVFEMLLEEGAVSKLQYTQAIENQTAAQLKLDTAIATAQAAQEQLEILKDQEDCTADLVAYMQSANLMELHDSGT